MNESNNSYHAWNAKDRMAGASFGLIQFNQKQGSLCLLLRKMQERDPKRFLQIFGDDAKLLLDPDRMKLADLGSLKDKFISAGHHPPFMQVQRDVAYHNYLVPAVALGRRYGLRSERAAAMLFDVAVQYGLGGLRKKLEEAQASVGGCADELDFEPRMLLALCVLCDTHDNMRRHKLRGNPMIRDIPFEIC